ncbi:hypothetical protein HanIR_Chr15g0781471 [Helianthus annuus]|nr:hypothetical protein HanIR_Chr15g0781471 [Helianthus annuus]
MTKQSSREVAKANGSTIILSAPASGVSNSTWQTQMQMQTNEEKPGCDSPNSSFLEYSRRSSSIIRILH